MVCCVFAVFLLCFFDVVVLCVCVVWLYHLCSCVVVGVLLVVFVVSSSLFFSRFCYLVFVARRFVSRPFGSPWISLGTFGGL